MLGRTFVKLEALTGHRGWASMVAIMTPSTMPEAPSPRGSGSPAPALFW